MKYPKMKHPMTVFLSMASLWIAIGTVFAAEEKPPTLTEKVAEQAAASPDTVVGETLTATMQVLAVDVKKRTLTLKDSTGDVFTLDVPPEVRRLAEINAGDLVIAQYQHALALGIHKVDSTGGIRSQQTTVSVGRAERDQPPAGVVRENVEIIAKVMAVDEARRKVTVRGAVHTVTLNVPEDVDISGIAVGDEVRVSYVQELAIRVEPAPPEAVEGWSKK